MSHYRIADWSFDADQGLLTRGGEAHHLRPQSALVLERLIQSAPEITSREELRELLWPGTVVVDFDTGINSCVSQIRTALGETAQQPVHVWTVPKKGFRFVPDVPRAEAEPVRPRSLWLAFGIMVLAVVLILNNLMWPATRPQQVLAVLPFDDLSGTPESNQLKQGILADLVVSIGNLDPEQLGILSRKSVLATQLEGRSARAIGRELGATHLLEGTIRRVAGSHLVTLSLVRVDDGRFLWGELIEISDRQSDHGLALLQATAVAEVQVLIEQQEKSASETTQ